MLATNEINRMYEKVIWWLSKRTPGGLIYGRPRIGKTRAIKLMMQQLPIELGSKLQIFLIICRQYKTANENVFFEDLLRNVNHSEPSRGTASAKRDRLFNHLYYKGQSSEEKRIVMIIDEAQHLHDSHFGWLMDVYNELDRVNIDMSVILVGQEEELEGKKGALKNASKSQIIGRFMVHEHKFSGIKNIDDLKTCITGYDEESEYPNDSGCTYTQYFFPKLYENGFRLYQYAEDLFEAFNNIRQREKIYGPIEIPMQYLTSTIEYLLIHYGADGEDIDQLTKDQLEESILYSGYVEQLFNPVV
ncbi:ATP-binding protein [Bacillus sp. ISL-75]|nr:ATP-binding protein [Bacillus sp. ISL-75]